MTPRKAIYLDHAATTPLDPRVLDAMLPWLADEFANASSIHTPGRKANVAVEEARERIAHHLGAIPSEIIFTSGGTESDNSVLLGVPLATGKKHCITSNAEHHAVLHALPRLEAIGGSSTVLEVGDDGAVTLSQLNSALTPETGVLSLMHVNNETGVIHPIKKFAQWAHENNLFFHTDAVQSIGKVPLSVKETEVDFLSVSGHKLHGPKGIGFLYARSGSEWDPFIQGGSQERRRRGGTLNVAGIVGLGVAVDLAYNYLDERMNHLSTLKTYFEQGLRDVFGTSIFFNHRSDGSPHIVNISFDEAVYGTLDGEMLLLNLDIEGIYCSNGSACSSGAIEPSHVLMAIGRSEKEAKSSLRFSLGKDNRKEDIDRTIEVLSSIIQRMSKKRSLHAH